MNELKFFSIKFMFCLLLVSLFSGCMSMSAEYRKLEQHKANRDWESAYDISQKLLIDHSNSKKLQEQHKEIADKLGEEYVLRAKELEKDSLKKFDLNSQASLYEKACQLISDEKNLACIKKKTINEKIEDIGHEIEKFNGQDVLDQIITLYTLNEYSKFIEPVGQIKRGFLENIQNFSQRILELMQEGEDYQAYGYSQLLKKLYPDSNKLVELNEKIIHGLQKDWMNLARKYTDVQNNERIGSAIFYYIFLDGLYHSPEIEKKIQDLSELFWKNKPVSVGILFSPSFSQKFKAEMMKEIEKFLQNNKKIKEIKEVTEEVNDNNLIVKITLNDVAIETKTNNETKYSEFLAGYQQEPNPEYDSLVVQYNEAVRQAEYYERDANENPSFTTGFNSSMYRGLAQRYSQAVARTPRFIKVPVYQDYSYEEIKIIFDLQFDCEYEFILNGGLVFSTPEIFKRNENVVKSFNQGVHPKDRNGLSNSRIDENLKLRVFENFREEKFKEISRKLSSEVNKYYVMKARIDLRNNDYGAVFEDLSTEYLFSNLSVNKRGVFSDFLSRIVRRNIPTHFKNLKSDLTSSRFIASTLGFGASDNLELDSFYSNWDMQRFYELGDYSKNDRDQGFSPRKETVLGLSGVKNPVKVDFIESDNLFDKVLKSVVVIKTMDGFGSGFLIHPEGYVISNYHVVGDNTDIVVKFNDGRKYFGNIVKLIKEKDLALLKIAGGPFEYLSFSEVSSKNLGEIVYALGAPGMGDKMLEASVTKGVISSVRKLTSLFNPMLEIEFIQTDAAINPGNSGGPLINDSGKVVGVNSQKYVDVNVEGLNFSISTKEVLSSFDGFIK